MSLKASENSKSDITRNVADFHPNVWGDYFLSRTSDSMNVDDDTKEQVERLKEEVRRLIGSADEPSEILNLIDVIQRLGVAYHFDQEIDEALQLLFKTHSATHDADDLHRVALRFRLLRQHGINVSCDAFNKFTDSNGHLRETLKNDIKGLLSLYEAANLRIHGEHILDDALDFATTHLESIVSQLSPSLAEQVSHALRQPLHKSLSRVEARRFISIYEEDASHNEMLLNFAKLDFNVLQKMHQKELKYISEWWKDLDFASKLPVRDRLVESYFWALGVYFEPQYSLGREILTKVFSVSSIIDDIYDAYGTLQELDVFTDAINRWDIDCINQLPEYMKLCYKTLLEVYEEIEMVSSKQGRPHNLHSKEEMKKLVECYMVQAKWTSENYVPKFDEYVRIALVSSGYSLLTTLSFVGMGDFATKEVFDWASTDSKIVRATSLMCRLTNDIVSHEFEQKRGHVASSVECYTKQHGVSEEVAINELNKQIIDAWKDINEECLKAVDNVPMQFIIRVVNLARVIDYCYKDGDEYTHVGDQMKSGITSLLVDPVKCELHHY